MRIKTRLPILMAEKRLNQAEVCRMTGIRPATMSSIYWDEIQRLDMRDLARLCHFLQCTPGDLFYLDETEPWDDKPKRSKKPVTNAD